MQYLVPVALIAILAGFGVGLIAPKTSAPEIGVPVETSETVSTTQAPVQSQTSTPPPTPQVTTPTQTSTNQPGTTGQVGSTVQTSRTSPQTTQPAAQSTTQTTSSQTAALREQQTQIDTLRRQVASLQSSGLSVTSPVTQVIERVVTGTASYSKSEIDAKVASLQGDISSARTTAANSSSAVFQAVAQTNRIDQLNGVRIVSPTISGTVTGLTDAAIPDDITLSTSNVISVSSTATSTFSGGIDLSSGCIAVSGVCISGSQWTTAGTSAVYTAGKVGIGTTSPWRTLSVYGSSDLGINAYAGYFTATTSTASSFPYASSTALSASGFVWAGNLSLTGSSTLQNYTAVNGTSSAMSILGLLQAGNLSLTGSTTLQNVTAVAATSSSLYVTGLTQLANLLSLGSSTLQSFTAQSATTSALVVTGASSLLDGIIVGSNTLFAQSGDGNVGIGTSSPYARLSVAGRSNGTAPLFVISTSTAAATTTAFIVDANGRVGVGTSTPSFELDVSGSVAGISFVNYSLESMKNSIEYLTPEDESAMLGKIKELKLAEYRYNMEPANNPLRIGVLAGESPREILSPDGLGVDLYKFVTFAVAGLKAQQKAIEVLQAGTGGQNAFQSMKEWVIDSLTTKKMYAREEVEIGTADIPVGITLYDTSTKQPYCVAVTDGTVVTTNGKCFVGIAPQGVTSNAQQTLPEATSTEPSTNENSATSTEVTQSTE